MTRFIFTTKLGHFLFIIIISFLLELIVSYYTNLSLGFMFIGSIFITLFLVIYDNNKKWY
jgi:hypothetical protein